MTIPMGVLALAAIVVAIFPQLLATASARVAVELIGSNTSTVVTTTVTTTAATTTVASMGTLNGILLGAIALAIALSKVLLRNRSRDTDTTWGCGFASPSLSRMQYTGRSFAELISERLLPNRLRARSSTPFAAVGSKHAIFAERRVVVASEFSDPLTRGMYEPVLVRLSHRFARLRWVQQGLLHAYLLYIAVAILLALAWISLRTWSKAGG